MLAGPPVTIIAEVCHSQWRTCRRQELSLACKAITLQPLHLTSEIQWQWTDATAKAIAKSKAMAQGMAQEMTKSIAKAVAEAIGWSQSKSVIEGVVTELQEE